MGSNQSQLTEDELADYKELTFLTKKEILHAFERFKQLDPRAVKRDKTARIPASKVANIPELKNNPFTSRICTVFDSEDDGCLSFEDFLDMVSVFNPTAPLKTKSDYAFHIYDFDEDGYLSGQDICEVVRRLTSIGHQMEDAPSQARDALTEREMEILVEKVMEEADLDKDDMLSAAEFEHVMRKSPDLAHTFSFRL